MITDQQHHQPDTVEEGVQHDRAHEALRTLRQPAKEQAKREERDGRRAIVDAGPDQRRDDDGCPRIGTVAEMDHEDCYERDHQRSPDGNHCQRLARATNINPKDNEHHDRLGRHACQPELQDAAKEQLFHHRSNHDRRQADQHQPADAQVAFTGDLLKQVRLGWIIRYVCVALRHQNVDRIDQGRTDQPEKNRLENLVPGAVHAEPKLVRLRSRAGYKQREDPRDDKWKGNHVGQQADEVLGLLIIRIRRKQNCPGLPEPEHADQLNQYVKDEASGNQQSVPGHGPVAARRQLQLFPKNQIPTGCRSGKWQRQPHESKPLRPEVVGVHVFTRYEPRAFDWSG